MFNSEIMFQTYPLVYIMMTRKTQKAYEHALRYVNDNVFSLQCEAMITDYEEGMRNAVREVVPGLGIQASSNLDVGFTTRKRSDEK